MALVKDVIRAMRWKAGDLVENPFGDHVWLKDCLDEEGRKIGITDCCLANDPCDVHKASA
jgi:hypothetical protein